MAKRVSQEMGVGAAEKEKAIEGNKTRQNGSAFHFFFSLFSGGWVCV